MDDVQPLSGALRCVSPLSAPGMLLRLVAVLLGPALLLLGWRISLVLAALTALLTASCHQHWWRLGVPHYRPLPLVGSLGPLLLHQLSPAHLLAQLHLHPPGSPNVQLVGFYIFHRPALLVRDPDLVRHVLVKDFAAFPERHTQAPPEDALGCLNLFGARAALWRRLRNSTSRAFTGARMRSALPHIDRCACALVKALGESGARPVKVRHLAARCVSDALTSCLFGVSGGGLSAAARRVFVFSARRALEVLAVFVAPALAPLRLCRPRFFGGTAERVFRAVFSGLARRRGRDAPPDKPRDLFDMLMALDPTDPASELCVAQASIFLSAGSDTTATVLSCCLFELAANPEVQRRLRAEVVGALGQHGGELCYQTVASMAYLDMVIAETLRKYPALAFVERRCRRRCRLAAVTLEAGAPVYVSTLGLHHDARFFPRPHRFDPERFTAEARRSRHPYCYAPFGHGPRSCIGMRLGLLTLKVVVSRVVSSFQVSPAPETPKQLSMSALALLLSPVGGIPLIFTPFPQD